MKIITPNDRFQTLRGPIVDDYRRTILARLLAFIGCLALRTPTKVYDRILSGEVTFWLDNQDLPKLPGNICVVVKFGSTGLNKPGLPATVCIELTQQAIYTNGTQAIPELTLPIKIELPDQILYPCEANKYCYQGMFYNTTPGDVSSNLYDLTTLIAYAIESGVKDIEGQTLAHIESQSNQHPQERQRSL